jgi:hypothetical protein
MSVFARHALIFGGVGIGLGLVAFVLYRLDRAYTARCLKTTGDVIAVEARNFQKGKRALVEFKAGDRAVRFHEWVGSSMPTKKPGDRIDVLYDPENPGNALVDDFWNHYLLVVIFGGIGGAFLAASLIVGIVAIARRGGP